MTTALAPVQPVEKHKYQLTEFGDNHNKTWEVDVFPGPGGDVAIRTRYGRVGSAFQHSPRLDQPPRPMSRRALDGLIAEKRKKGYREVDLHAATTTSQDAPQSAPGAPGAAIDPRVEELVALLFREAGEAIKGYLAVKVDALSQAQISQGRRLLLTCLQEYQAWKAGGSYTRVVGAVTDYYNTIPTQLPRKLRDNAIIQSIVEDLCRNPQEQETRLDQLESALGTIQVTGQHESAYARLGAQIALLDPQDPDRQQVERFIVQGNPHGYRLKIHDVFAIEVPSERRAYLTNDFGRHLELRLTHGTANANVRHIVREAGPGSGLRLPKYPTSGWLLGSGIYLADQASKSVGYTRSGGNNPRILLLCDAAVGDMYTPRNGDSSMRAAPSGYHSTFGKAGYTGFLRFNEYVVYRANQVTIRYLVTFESY